MRFGIKCFIALDCFCALENRSTRDSTELPKSPEGLTGALKSTAFSATFISVSITKDQTTYGGADRLCRHLSGSKGKISDTAKLPKDFWIWTLFV